MSHDRATTDGLDKALVPADPAPLSELEASILSLCPVDWMNLIGGYTFVRATEEKCQAALDGLSDRGLAEAEADGAVIVRTDAGDQWVERW